MLPAGQLEGLRGLSHLASHFQLKLLQKLHICTQFLYLAIHMRLLYSIPIIQNQCDTKDRGLFRSEDKLPIA